MTLHRHDSVIDTTKWAQEYFQKPLSVSTIRRAICRCQLKLYHAKRKPYVNMVQKCISAYSMGSLHVLEGTMNAERYIKILEQHMLISRRRVFQQDNAKPHIAAITTAWFFSRRVRVLNWPGCSPDISPIEHH